MVAVDKNIFCLRKLCRDGRDVYVFVSVTAIIGVNDEFVFLSICPRKNKMIGSKGKEHQKNSYIKIRPRKSMKTSTTTEDGYDFGIVSHLRSEENNGINLFVSDEQNSKYQKDTGGVITIGLDTQTVFYQPQEFYTGQNIQILKNEKLSKFSSLFIIPLLKIQMEKFNWGGNGATLTRLKRTRIVLPIDSYGNPNWKFMEDYIKQEMKKQSQRVITYYKNKLMKLGFELLDLEVEWKDFWMEDILDISSGVRLTKADQVGGDMPFIGASDANNGVTEFVGNTNKSLDSNVLGVNYNGSVVENFYHSYECIFSDDVKRVKFKDKEYGDEFTYLFLKQMILLQKNKYQYGYKFNAKRMSRQKIMLPIDKNGEPHWEYMSNFVKKLEKENIEKTLNHIYIYNG